MEKVSKFRRFLINYLEHSSFHGVWHLTRIQQNHSVEFIFWSFTFITIVLFASYNISLVWLRYLYNSTVITIDRDYLNRNTTFPPLTVCMRQRLNESALEEFLISRGFNSSQRSDVELRKFLTNLSHFNISNLSELISVKRNYFNVDDYLDILLKISNKFPHNITVSFASTNEQFFFFEPILIDELGLCYTFNSKISFLLSPSYLRSGNLENNSTMKIVEEINYFDGEASAVTADLFNNVDIYYHGPYQVPSNLRKVLNADIKQKSYMTLTFIPVIIKSQENIKNLFEFQRKCKFADDDSGLTYFQKVYSQDLCLYECRMKKFFDLCKCMPFFYKHKSDDKQCNKHGLKCIVQNKAIIDSLRADVECGCLKDCNEIKYSLQTSTTMFWFRDSRVSWTLLQNKVIYKRELIHDVVEALILTGASLSLFIGMSCLTIVEVFFFIYLYVMKVD